MTSSAPTKRTVNLSVLFFMAFLAVIVLFLLQTRNQSKKNGALAQQVKTLVERGEDDDRERGKLLLELKTQGDKLEDLAHKQELDSKEIKAAARVAERAAVASEKASSFLVACFQPGGLCAKAAEENRRFIEGIGRQVVAQVGELKFIVTEIRPGVFEAKQAPPAEQAKPCVPIAQIGNIGVGEGVLCRTP